MVTLLEQELDRYRFDSFWKPVQIALFVGTPFLASYLGKYVYDTVLPKDNPEESAHLLLPAVNYSVFFLHNLFLYILYTYKIPFFEQYKVHPGPWQWEHSPETWPKVLKETLMMVAFNFVVLSSGLATLMKTLFGNPTRIDASSLPTALEVFWQVGFCMVIEDCAFHHSHQLLHTRALYWVHKVHHRYHATFGLAAVYAHPIEYIIGNLIPSALGPFLLGSKMHVWTFTMWTVFRVNGGIENHSGYEFPWTIYQLIPFKAPTDYHDFHHSKNMQNFSGVLRIWDWVYGTNKYYFDYKNKQEKLKQREEKERKQA